MKATSLLLLLAAFALQSCSKQEYQCECTDWARGGTVVETKTIETNRMDDATIECSNRQSHYDKHPFYDHVYCSIK